MNELGPSDTCGRKGLSGLTRLPIDISVTLLQGDTILKKYAAYLPTVVLLLTDREHRHTGDCRTGRLTSKP